MVAWMNRSSCSAGNVTYLAQLPWIQLIANIRGQRHCIQVVQRSSKPCHMWVKLAQWARDLHFIKPSTCVVDPYAFDTFSFQERSGNSVFNPHISGMVRCFISVWLATSDTPSCLKTIWNLPLATSQKTIFLWRWWWYPSKMIDVSWCIFVSARFGSKLCTLAEYHSPVNRICGPAETPLGLLVHQSEPRITPEKRSMVKRGKTYFEHTKSCIRNESSFRKWP